MDSLVLLERLDELMAEAKPIPFTREARVDRDEVYKILDRIRTTLPVEFERVRWMGRESEQEEGIEARLGQVSEAVAELRRQSERTSRPPITIAAAEQVREIVEAAERTAAGLEQQASADARQVREEADRYLRAAKEESERLLRAAKEESERLLRETRERAAAEAADYLRRVEEATETLLERANTAGSELDGMLANLRGSGGSVMEELEAIMAGLTKIEVRRTQKPARPEAPVPLATGGGEGRPPAAPASSAAAVARLPGRAPASRPANPAPRGGGPSEGQHAQGTQRHGRQQQGTQPQGTQPHGTAAGAKPQAVAAGGVRPQAPPAPPAPAARLPGAPPRSEDRSAGEQGGGLESAPPASPPAV